MVKIGDILVWNIKEEVTEENLHKFDRYEVMEGDILYYIKGDQKCLGYTLKKIQEHIEEGDCFIENQTYEIY